MGDGHVALTILTEELWPVRLERPGIFLLPLDGTLAHRMVTFQHWVRRGTHLYAWVVRDTVRVKCLVQERNTTSPARTRTRTARSGVECTNHEATTPHGSVFSITRFKIVMQCFLVVYHGIPTCHLYFHSPNERGSCVIIYQENTSFSLGIHGIPLENVA